MVECPICKGDLGTEYLKGQALDVLAGQEYMYFHCPKCDILVIKEENLQENNEMIDYSNSGYYSEKENKAKRFIEALGRLFYSLRCNIVKKHLGENGFSGLKILDIGCGKGGFLYQVKSQGACIYGLEPTTRSFNEAQNRLGNCIIKSTMTQELYEKSSIDVVTMWHVFEHVSLPKEMLKSCFNVLKSNGLLVIAVPNYRGWTAQLGSGVWFNLDPPRHVVHYSVEGLSRIVENSGFRILEVSHHYAELTYFSMLQTLLNKLPITNNFLFNYLKRNSKALPHSRLVFYKDLLMTTAVGGFLLPLVIVITIMSSMFRASDCITLIATKN